MASGDLDKTGPPTRWPQGWYAVALAREIAPGQVVAKRRFGEDIVLFRTPQGDLAAVEDRCPHRSVRLRRGRVTEEGCLQCPYHGFEFDRTGRCTHIPANPEGPIAQTLQARTHAVCEQDGLVYLWHGASSVDKRPPPKVPTFDPASGFFHSFWEEQWKTRLERAVENQLDMGHLPFVHKGTIGGGMPKQIHVEVEPIEQDGAVVGLAAGHRGRRQLELYFPNVWINLLGDKGRVTAFFAPVDEGVTDVTLSFGHRFVGFAPLARLIAWAGATFSTRVTAQDKPIVEDHVEGDPRAEALVQFDLPIARYRRWVKDNLPGPDDGVTDNVVSLHNRS